MSMAAIPSPTAEPSCLVDPERTSPAATRTGRTVCPFRARPDGELGQFTVTHGQSSTPPTCVNAAQTTGTRNLPSWWSGRFGSVPSPGQRA